MVSSLKLIVQGSLPVGGASYSNVGVYHWMLLFLYSGAEVISGEEEFQPDAAQGQRLRWPPHGCVARHLPAILPFFLPSLTFTSSDLIYIAVAYNVISRGPRIS